MNSILMLLKFQGLTVIIPLFFMSSNKDLDRKKVSAKYPLKPEVIYTIKAQL